MPDQKNHQLIGCLVVCLGALAFSGNNAFAVLSFEGGSDPLTLITSRMAFALIALTFLMKILGLNITLSPKARNTALGLGVLNGTMAFCLLSAFDSIPVGLAVLIFYSYPMLTGLSAWIWGQERLSFSVGAVLIIGFLGLAVALEFSILDLNIVGLLFASAASALMASTILLSNRILEPGNAKAVTLHMHVSSAFIFALASIILGEFNYPKTYLGWLGFLCVPLFYTIAIAAFFFGIAYIGPVRASLFMNIEPIGTIILGFLLLNQQLTAGQLLGASIVICSLGVIVMLEVRQKKAHKES